MSTGRLTFLYPHLLRTARTSVTHNSITTRWVATTRPQSSFAPRHGKAVEPTWDKKAAAAADAAATTTTPPPEQPKKKRRRKTALPNADETKEAQSRGSLATRPGEEAAVSSQQAEQTQREEPVTTSSVAPLHKTEQTPQARITTTATNTASTDTNAAQSSKKSSPTSSSSSSSPPPPASASTLSASSLDVVPVMHMPLPDKTQHPHMTPPPYVHHFDSYSMVKLLEEGGYTRDQAVSSMKAIRTILGGNLDVAQRSLVSKSDVENEAYLFHAACSELSTEIKNNRRLQEEQMRQQRTHLQHEVDILTQTLSQELLTLNDSVKGLFNDRNMAVREEQKAVESAIQQINYKMSILLSSDSKSEIEGVRWVLIRRSVVGLLFLAVLTLSMIRYTTYLAQQKKREAEQRRKERERLRRDGGRTDNSASADAALILSAS
ncbi:hypothetical protein E4U55_000576 [Claviceps digitariae]|nr:hypothetical protein E4U55_000576 [Claviceps digitariae]